MLKRRRRLVLHHFDADPAPRHLLPLLDGLDSPNVQPHRRIKLQGVPAGRGFGIAEHHPDLHPDLVDEDHRGHGFGNGPRQFAEGLGHQARLKPHVRIAHFTFDFSTGHQGGDGVHDHQVDGSASDQRLGNLQGLLSGVRLGHQQIVASNP